MNVISISYVVKECLSSKKVEGVDPDISDKVTIRYIILDSLVYNIKS